MPTRNVNLTKHFDKFVEDGVVSGRFGNASEVVREGLRLLEQREKEEKAWLKYLDEAAKEGIDAVDQGKYYDFKTPEDLHEFVRGIGDEARAKTAMAGRQRA